jgi:excisionase family DNA binding protein
MHARAGGLTAPDTSERGHSIEEAAKRMGIGRSTVYELLALGELESITIGRRRIVPESAIRSFFAARRAADRAERGGAR